MKIDVVEIVWIAPREFRVEFSFVRDVGVTNGIVLSDGRGRLGLFDDLRETTCFMLVRT